KAFEKTEGASIAIEDETVQLTLPDKSLFETTGLNVSAAGKNLLTPLANFLAERPELDIDVVAYTDNVLPKDNKSLKDTWDWSLQRATNIVRLLIREYNVNANQLTPVGRGEFYPVTSNETADGRQQNRRTVVVFRPVLAVVPSE
ncbi:MAG: OmpA family protein, partial [Bacteroidota bacterium]